MQWAQAAILIVINLLTAAFVYGRLTERVKEQSGKILHLEHTSDDHEKRISYAEGLRDGRRTH